MISFSLSLVALLLGYLLYGRFVERVFRPDDRVTPAVAKADGLDYIALPNWKVFMIQFLNIAGTGPIFGAIMGAKFGPVAYLWIVLGCIFAGATHDYLSGMLSMRNEGVARGSEQTTTRSSSGDSRGSHSSEPSSSAIQKSAAAGPYRDVPTAG